MSNLEFCLSYAPNEQAALDKHNFLFGNRSKVSDEYLVKLLKRLPRNFPRESVLKECERSPESTAKILSSLDN